MQTKINPKPKKEYVLDYSNLCGGLNLWDPDYRLKPSESPEMKNLLWRNGMLCSRKGQVYLSDTALGRGIAAYPRFWHGAIFAHIGDAIYCFKPSPGGEGDTTSAVTDEVTLASEDLVCSLDDGTHYYLTVNGHTWAWNYELSGYKDPS